MVWSSAQPHTVQDMVGKCFGASKNKLVAVWTRDAFGLTKGEYRAYFRTPLVYFRPILVINFVLLSDHKTQTLKDLNKPWSEIPVSSVMTETYPPNDDVLNYSALTTILLDDSQRKAQLQPWNHVVIQEYVHSMRTSDLQVSKRETTEMVDDDGEIETAYSTKQQHADMEQPHGSTDVEASSSASPPTSPRTPANVRSMKYDETLLAIVGILDAIKGESNVAGWIRAGGLWGVVAFDREQKEHLHLSSSPLPLDGGDFGYASSALWYQEPTVLDYWITRGRRVLTALDIDIIAGVSD